jgi:hypothetical protein
MPDTKLPKKFEETVQKLNNLNTAHQSGKITDDVYDTEVLKLVIQDKDGQSWWLTKQGEWLWYNGKSWVPQDPPTVNRKKISWPIIVVPAVIILVCLCASMIFGLLKLGDGIDLSAFFPNNSQEEVYQAIEEDIQAPENEPSLDEGALVLPEDGSKPSPPSEDFTLSQQQLSVVDDFGKPDAFTLVEVDDPDGNHIRHEVWAYYQGKTSFTFVEGVFINSGEVEVLPEGYFPTPYHPEQFSLGNSSEQVRAVLGDYPISLIENSEAIQPGAQFFAGQQLILGFLEDRLYYVEALVFIPEGSGQ